MRRRSFRRGSRKSFRGGGRGRAGRRGMRVGRIKIGYRM
ncbi:MAG: hypothetical protein [Microvirus sp.]|nr:MAG: hypothetical protein [Microvirus sp.]